MRSAASKPDEPFEIYTKVAGVTFENRQSKIQRYCKPGMNLAVIPEPDNPHSRDALGLWVTHRGWLSTSRHQVGYVPQDEAHDLRKRLKLDWTIAGEIDAVVGGGEDRSLGLRITLIVRPPQRSASRAIREPTAVVAEKAPIVPAKPREPLTKRQARILGSASVFLLGIFTAVVGGASARILGRPSSLVPIGVVMTAVGAGLIGITLTLSAGDDAGKQKPPAGE